MRHRARLFFLGGISAAMAAGAVAMAEPNWTALERQWRELPMEARRQTGPLFWLHGDESKERLEFFVQKVAEGGNGTFTAESRPHSDWLGDGWFRDLGICLAAAKQNNLTMWIFDEKWWPSQGIGGKVIPQYSAKQLVTTVTDLEGPSELSVEGHDRDNYVASVAARMTADGKVDGSSLLDLAPFVKEGSLTWKVPAGKWRMIKFTHKHAPGLGQGGGKQLSVDGASKECVDWFLEKVYQPHYDAFKNDFGRTIQGFFYDEPETRGDWGTELNRVLLERRVDWKKAYVAYKFELAGEEQAAARFQYLDAFAETWGRTMYGGMADWCHRHRVKSIGHFMEHGGLYLQPDFCAGDMMRLQRYSDMGAIDAVFTQFVMGRRDTRNPPCWQTPKLASSISHVFGKADDVTMVEIFGARGQDLTYPEMKWWTDHMQVSGVNFLIPHSFNPRVPRDTDCPPYFYMDDYEPRWPLYRVFADYTSRLSLLLAGGRHVCPVAVLFSGNARQVGKMIPPEQISESLQDALFDCDWLPWDVFERDADLGGRQVVLRQERYRVLVVPPVEVISYATLAKVKRFFDSGGIVVGYGFLPSKSATLGKTSADIVALRDAIWGKATELSLAAHNTNPAGGRAYFLGETPTPEELQRSLTGDGGVHPTLEVLEGTTDHWLHVLHRVKSGRDVFLVCNQNHEGAARHFKFRVAAAGEPECWDAVRNEIASVPYQRVGDHAVELSLTLEPNESVLLVFQPGKSPRLPRFDATVQPAGNIVAVTRQPNPPVTPPAALPAKGVTVSPLKAADPFLGRCDVPLNFRPASFRVYLEMLELPAPEQAAAVTVNGQYAGGVIGKPFRLEVTAHLKPGENTIVIAPLAPKAARLVFYANKTE